MKKLLPAIFFAIGSLFLFGQDNNVLLGYLNTALEQNALRFAVDYSKKLKPKLELFKSGKASLVSFSPDIRIDVGSDDAFNGIIAKYTGNIMKFKTTTVAGIDEVPDLSKVFHNFPVSAGFETNQSFSSINGLLEFGYVPWYMNDKDLPKFVRQTRIGVFVQGGYKFKLSDQPDTVFNSGAGNIDESKENSDSELLRLKASAVISPHFYLDKDKKLGFAIIGKGDVWYDIINTEFYYSLLGAIRFIYEDYYIDTKYEKGSGAPNFNQGSQFGVNLGMQF
ncbi:MAG: hypothetical protein HQ565_09175 [Bacteroidetes bacterium]|nr:hypothetical protein [Bacteroidota bacterium]